MYDCAQLHFCQETRDGVGINTPQVTLDKGDTLFKGQALTRAKGEKALCGSGKKIATAARGVEHTHSCKVIVRGIGTGVQYFFN